jgi:hypothetical protein
MCDWFRDGYGLTKYACLDHDHPQYGTGMETTLCTGNNVCSCKDPAKRWSDEPKIDDDNKCAILLLHVHTKVYVSHKSPSTALLHTPKRMQCSRECPSKCWSDEPRIGDDNKCVHRHTHIFTCIYPSRYCCHTTLRKGHVPVTNIAYVALDSQRRTTTPSA